jgi:hypothetical protein
LVKTKLLVISAIALLLFVGLSCLTNPVLGAFTPTVSSPAQTENTITLSWTKSNDILFTSYEVTYATFVNGPYYSVTTITDKSQTSYAITGLTPSTPYYFIIKDKSNDVISSSTSSSNTLQANTVPNPKISVTSTTQSTVSLQWIDYNSYTSVMPFQSYVIQMSTNNGAFSTLTTISDVSQNTYTVTGLSPATYQFQMYDEVGSSGQHQDTTNIATAYVYSPVQVQISNPSTDTVEMGQQLQLLATAIGGTSSYMYQWYSNGNPITGANSATYYYYPSDTGTVSIYVTVKDSQVPSLATATSNTITLNTPLTANLKSTIPTTPELTLPIVLLALAIATCSAILIKAKPKKSD